MTLHDTYDPSNIFAKILRGEMPAVKVYEDDTAPQHTSPPAVDVHHPPRHVHQLPSAILTELEEACSSTRVQVKEVENRIQQIQV